MSAGESKTVDVKFFNDEGILEITVTLEEFSEEPISHLLLKAEQELGTLRSKRVPYYFYHTYANENEGKRIRVPDTPLEPTFTLKHMNAGRDTIYICVATKVPVRTSDAYAGQESEYGIPRAVPLRM